MKNSLSKFLKIVLLESCFFTFFLILSFTFTTVILNFQINAHKDLLLQKKGDLEAKDSAIALHQKYIKAVEGSLEPKDIQLAKQKAELESHLDKIQNQSSEIANLTANLEAERNKVLEHLRVNNVSKMDNEKLQDENLKQKLQIETHFEQLKLQVIFY